MKPGLIRLSQAHLNLLQHCPPQFQQVYLDQLRSPLPPQQQEKLDWGNRFHLLMQQRELGLPIAGLLTADEELGGAVAGLLAAAPELFHPSGHALAERLRLREAEHSRTLAVGRYLLTVIYDLAIAREDRGLIIDWKTYQQKPRRENLGQDWQTRLYLYVWAETSDYLPEQLEIIYWFVRGKIERERFVYDSSQHQQTRQDLQKLLGNLDRWLEDYLDRNIPFPHGLKCETDCPYRSTYLARQASSNPKNKADWLDSLSEIAEVTL